MRLPLVVVVAAEPPTLVVVAASKGGPEPRASEPDFHTTAADAAATVLPMD